MKYKRVAQLESNSGIRRS